MSTIHQPVLLNEVIDYLDPQPGQNFIDCTFGGGGHSRAILQRIGPDGTVLGIDQDIGAVGSGGNNSIERLTVVHGNFEDLQQLRDMHLPKEISGILFDLGFSSDQLERSGRGFSFQTDDNLDMRLDQGRDLTAGEIVNTWPADEIEKLLRIYGEEESASLIAGAIVQQRKQVPIQTTFQLRDLILKAKKSRARRVYPDGRRSQAGSRNGVAGINPATKSFQALRIAVNRELDVLAKALPQAVELLAPAGRMAVISFHGLEDRIVKRFFRSQDHAKTITVVTKKPIRPSLQEVKDNPRSRSARMRVAEKR